MVGIRVEYDGVRTNIRTRFHKHFSPLSPFFIKVIEWPLQVVAIIALSLFLLSLCKRDTQDILCEADVNRYLLCACRDEVTTTPILLCWGLDIGDELSRLSQLDERWRWNSLLPLLRPTTPLAELLLPRRRSR